MKISVVIVSQNRDRLLRRAVASVEQQGHNPEIVIIDNCSDTAITADIAKSSTHIVIVRGETKTSAATSRNVGAAQSTGDVVCFLDDDDIYLPGKFDAISAALSDETLDFVYGATIMKGPNDAHLGLCSGPCEIETYLRWRYMHVNAMAVRRRVFETHRFDETMETFEDVAFAGDLIRRFNGAEIKGTHAVWNRDGRSDQLTKRDIGRSKRNWEILCRMFASEISGSSELRKLYHRKMAILCVLTGDISGACRYGIGLFRSPSPSP